VDFRKLEGDKMSIISVAFGRSVDNGEITVVGGSIKSMKFASDDGVISDGKFKILSTANRLLVDVKETKNATLRIKLDGDGFSVRLFDVFGSEFPIIIREFDVAVSTSDDKRSFAEIESARQHKMQGRLTALEQIDAEPEETFDKAAMATRDLSPPTWLGLSRDIRLFSMNFRGVGSDELLQFQWDWIQPLLAGIPLSLEESDGYSLLYHYFLGRGIAASSNISRRLIDGVTPILVGRIKEGDIIYETTSFVSLEQQVISEKAIKGTDFLLADGHTRGHMFTEEQQYRFNKLQEKLDPSDEQPVHFTRISITNRGVVPRYAFFKAPVPQCFVPKKSDFWGGGPRQLPHEFNKSEGFSSFSHDRVFCVSKKDGKPLDRSEFSNLIKPGETVEIEFRIPHSPLTHKRAEALAAKDFTQELEFCRKYWNGKKFQAAEIKVPELRINEMIQAGLHHLDLVTYGEEPNGPLCPTLGLYSPIGSECGPVIQFFDSVGLHNRAERALDYFLEKQHENGFMQNFDNYMLETEALLWTFGEHYKYTKDHEWVRRIQSKLLLASQYILNNRAKRKALSKSSGGYGLIAGRTADPEDPFEAFMLNGFAYLGLARLAEMLKGIGEERESKRISSEALAFKEDIRSAFFDGVARSPVIPLGDGTWVRTAPPWSENDGPLCLDPEADSFYTHCTVAARDSLLGPLWLVFQEVFDPNEPIVDTLLAYHAELFLDRNAAFSQPYYSQHPLIHLKRGEVKKFLKSYYNMVSGLADRETYSFWEHYYHCGPHKTTEVAWFLMQTRWMLYLEGFNELKVFPGIPRAWLHPGALLELKNVASAFGNFSIKVTVSDEGDSFRVKYKTHSDHAAKKVVIRLPHPNGKRIVSTNQGEANPATESVEVVGSEVDFVVWFRT